MLLRISIILYLLFCYTIDVRSQDQVYDPVTFRLYWGRDLIGDIEILYSDEGSYVSLPDLLKHLSYPYVQTEDSLVTEFPEQGDTLVVVPDSVFYIGNRIPCKSVWSEYSPPYLPLSTLEVVSGMQFKMIVNSLSLQIHTVIETPAIKLIKRKMWRDRILAEREGKESITDSFPNTNFRVSSIGYQLSPLLSTNESIKASLGMNVSGILLGGGYSVFYDYFGQNVDGNNAIRFDWLMQNLRNEYVKRIQVYRARSVSEISSYSYSNMASFSNYAYRESVSRRFMYRSVTIPNTFVELYHNSRLEHYVKSDSLGFYEGKIDLLPGLNTISTIRLDKYVMEHRVDEEIYLPPRMQKKGGFNYNLQVGMSDAKQGVFLWESKYGMNDYVTLLLDHQGILSKNTGYEQFTLLGMDYAIGKHMRGNIAYSPNFRMNSAINVTAPSVGNLMLSYWRYDKDQTLVLNAPEQSWSALISTYLNFLPWRNTMTVSIQDYHMAFGRNFSTYLSWNNFHRNWIWTLGTSSSSLDKVAYSNPVINTQIGYRISNKAMVEVANEYKVNSKSDVLRGRFNYSGHERLKAYLNTEYHFRNNYYSVNLGLRWILPNVEIQNTTVASKGGVSSATQFTGSVIFYRDFYTALSNQYLPGCSLRVCFFLDTDGDGKKSSTERILPSGRVRLNTNAREVHKSTGSYYFNITPYTMFEVEVIPQMFDDISYQVTPHSRYVYLKEKQQETLYIPVGVYSEIGGMVYMDGRAAGFVPVTITNKETKKERKVMTDFYGYYSDATLTPGDYTVSVAYEFKLEDKSYGIKEYRINIFIPNEGEGVYLDDLNFYYYERNKWPGKIKKGLIYRP